MYQGPPASSTVWPVGAVVSGVRVKVAVVVRPVPLVAVTVLSPVAVAVVVPAVAWWCTGSSVGRAVAAEDGREGDVLDARLRVGGGRGEGEACRCSCPAGCSRGWCRRRTSSGEVSSRVRRGALRRGGVDLRGRAGGGRRRCVADVVGDGEAVAVAVAGWDGGVGAAGEGDRRSSRRRCRRCRRRVAAESRSTSRSRGRRRSRRRCRRRG